jgi:hypothetical protein
MFFLGWINLMSFCVIGQQIGGEAIHGKVENGRYFLATGYISRGTPNPETPHEYIEVSPDIFRYSQTHGYCALVTFPLGLIAGVLGSIYERKRKRELTNVA